jgi:outer membrane protein assembly factor BamB
MPSRRELLRWGGGLGAAALAGCVATPVSEETFDPLAATDLDERATAQFRGGLRNRGYVDRAVPEAVTVDWSLPVNRGDHTAAKSTPVGLPDGDLLVGGDTGVLRRVGPDGTVRWSAQVTDAGRGIHGTPAVANGTAYIGAYDGVLSAWALATGERRWETRLGDAIGSSPVYHNGVCYIAVEFNDPSGSVAAVDAATGELRWTDGHPSDHPHSTLAIDREAGRLVVGSNDGTCYAWTFPGLERAWTYDTEGPIKGPVAIDDGRAVFGSWDHGVYAVDLGTGEEAWSFRAGADVMSAPAVHDGSVYVGSHDDRVYALDASDGGRQWSFDTGGWVIGAVTRTREHVLAGSYDDRLYALDAATGEPTWAATGRGRATSGPLVTGDAVYYAERSPDPGEEWGMLYRLVPG